jgi:hypothetical protein
MSPHLHAVLIAAAALLPAAPALAGRPFATEDAGVLAAGECEFEAYLGHASARGAPSESAWWLQPGCGLGRNLQLALGVGRSQADGTSASGVALGGKWGLSDGGDDAPQWALAFGTAAVRTGGRWQHDGHGATLVLSLPAAGGAWHANLGHARGDGTASTTWALAREHGLREGLDVGVEFYGDDHAAPWAGLGLRWAATERLTLDASAAWQADGGRARALSVGLKLAW